MTPQQKLKWAILAKIAEWRGEMLPAITQANVDAIYDALVNNGEHWDAMNAVREGELTTGIPCKWLPEFMGWSVASRMPDGSWVGWTYWSGRGTDANPHEIDWISDAYNVEHREETKTVTAHIFTKTEDALKER